jgi:hypothetical protein
VVRASAILILIQCPGIAAGVERIANERAREGE